MVRRLIAAGLLLAVAAGAARLVAQPAGAPAPPPSPAPQEAGVETPPPGIDVAGLRLREGSQLTDRLGRFYQSGDALTFIDEDNREIVGLANLNLERIIRTLKAVEDPEKVWWSISGTITEFSGNNYVLISRATYKAAAPPPAPESLPSVAATAAP